MTQATCPICHEPLEAGQTACPRCGFKLIGETQVFKPVSSEPLDEPPLSEGTVPALEVEKGPYAGESFMMGQGTFTVGRDPSCDIFLSNMTVSRHHATIAIGETGARIEDAGSLNGTWVNGSVVDAAELVEGTRVQIGTFEMTYKHLPKQDRGAASTR